MNTARLAPVAVVGGRRLGRRRRGQPRTRSCRSPAAPASSGLIAPATPSTLVSNMATGQGVPVTREKGGFVRLFFEAQGADGRTRAMWIDSKDGYYGLDFNAGAATTCSTAADYSAGGGCEPTVAIPVDGDVNGNSRINHSRQFKVAWPTLDSPHWDMAVGIVHGVHVRPGHRLLRLSAEPRLRRVGRREVGRAVSRQRLPEAVHERPGGISVSQRRRALSPVLRRPVDQRPGGRRPGTCRSWGRRS